MGRFTSVAWERARLDVAGALRDPLLVLLVALMPAATLVFGRDGEPVVLASLPAVTAGVVAGMLMIVLVARERFDGTVTRLRALPRGLPAYVVGRTAMTLCLVIAAVAVTLVVAFGAAGLEPPASGPRAWFPVVVGVLLGATAWGVIGIATAALLPSGNPMGAGSMLAQAAIMTVIFLSAGLVPLADLPAAARAVVQLLPAFWSGHLVRQGLLGDEAVAAEPSGEWQPALAVAVLAGWTVLGGVLTAWLLRRNTRRGDGRPGGRGED